MELKVVRWLIDKLIPYARNARTHSPEQIAQVAASITEFGFVNPILRTTSIIAGHEPVVRDYQCPALRFGQMCQYNYGHFLHPELLSCRVLRP